MKSITKDYMKNSSYESHSRIPLFIICILSILLRLFRLGSLPNSYYLEEMTNTYIGRFILLHGKDIYGHVWPLLYFDKFGDYPPVLPLYLSGLGTFFFGVNEFAGRFFIALIGALFPLFMYKLSLLIFQRRDVSLFVAFIAAVAPWHVVLSRTTAEGIIALTFFTWGIYAVLKGMIETKKNEIIKGVCILLLTYFFYPANRILVPLTLLPLPILAWKLYEDTFKLLVVALIVCSVLTAGISSTKWGKARFEQTSIFTSQSVKDSVAMRSQNQSNALGSNQIVLARIFHNKLVGYSREFFSQYLSYFSPRYLFFESGGQYRYYNVPDQGLLFLSFLPFFLFALGRRPQGIRWPLVSFILYLLVISPLPAALTIDFTPHAHRSVFMLLPLLIIAGIGFVVLKDGGLLKRLLLYGTFILIFCEFIYFWHQYSWISSSFQSVLRNDGDKQMIELVLQDQSKYQRIYMPLQERLPLYYLFYANNFDKDLIGAFQPEFKLDQIGNISFIDESCPTDTLSALSEGDLYIEHEGCGMKRGLVEIAAIKRHDSTGAYSLRIFRAGL